MILALLLTAGLVPGWTGPGASTASRTAHDANATLPAAPTAEAAHAPGSRAWSSTSTSTGPHAGPDEPVDFLRDVWPILDLRCTSCHGPDKQKGGLRLDQRTGLFDGEDGAAPVVPGKPDDSLMIQLVELDEEDFDLMPAAGGPLTAEQIATLRRWIAEGANWEAPPTTPEPERLALPPLDPARRAAVDAALARLRDFGAQAHRIAADSEAVEVRFSLLRDRADGTALTHLRGLEPALVHLDLSRTGIGDEDLPALATLTELRKLDLARTTITAKGLAALGPLPNLRTLNLYGTQVADDALETLAQLPALERVYLWQAPISEATLDTLRERRPGLQLIREQRLEAPAPIEPINATCPVTGDPIDPARYSTIQNQRIAFCCEKCKAAFDADPEAHLAKVPSFVRTGPKPAAAAKAVNAKCPVSGSPIDAAYFSTVDGQRIAFCCAKCKAAFDADPSTHLYKVEGFVRKADAHARAVNAKCPISGGPIDTAFFSTVDDQRIAFCCGKCKAAFDADPKAHLDQVEGFVRKGEAKQ